MKKVVVGVVAFLILGVGVARGCAVWIDASPPARNIGKYRIVETRVKESLGWFFCRPRQSIYFEGKHLGTCGMTGEGMYGIRNGGCIVVAPDASSAVYWHDPGVCSSGNLAPDKIRGIYAHNAQGERLIYKYPDVTVASVRREGDGLQVGWAPLPVGEEQRCRAALVVGPDGIERTVKPSDPRCR